MSGFDIFDRACNKANQWLNEVNVELGWTDRYDAYIALRSVLQTLRDLLPLEEAIDFGAQLPMILRGVFYEGWTGVPSPGMPSDPRGPLDRVSDYLAEAFLPPDGETVTKAVLKVLARRINDGELMHIGHRLPPSLRRLWPRDAAPLRAPLRNSRSR
jgi:uncharacterized protein (DUF2267 family)